MAYAPGIQPIINAGRFGVFPSGHATEAFLVARLLQRLGGAATPHDVRETQLQRLASRISNNRVVAGVHFPIDAPAGRMVGETLAEYLAYRSGNAGGWTPRRFLGGVLLATDAEVVRGFNRSEPMDSDQANGNPLPKHFAANTTGLITPVLASSLVPGTSTGLLAHLWGQAAKEWA